MKTTGKLVKSSSFTELLSEVILLLEFLLCERIIVHWLNHFY